MFLKVSPSPLHGRGCFATRKLQAGEEITRAPVLVFPPEQMEALHQTRLKDYLFYVKDGPRPEGAYHTAVAMSPLSFCNHSADANCDFRVDEPVDEIVLVARRDIAEGEEITIDYGDYAEQII